MKFNYGNFWKFGGIYKIINSINDRVYIGSASCFRERWAAHKHSLLNGKHSNTFLQNDYNKCKEEVGNDNFLEFHVVEVVESLVCSQLLSE